MSDPSGHITDALLAKFFHVRGCGFLRFATSFDRGLATSLFHDAVEIAARSCATRVGANPSKKLEFLGYWDEVHKVGKAAPQSELPMKLPMTRLNQARVDFKHHGNPPADASGFERDSRAFLKSVFRDFLGTDFDALSQADLVQDERMRRCMKAAEQALAAGRVRDCLCRCADAMDAAHGRRAELGDPGIIVRFSNIPAEVAPALKTLEENMWRHVRHVRDLAIAGILGLKLGEFSMIQGLVPDKFGDEYRFRIDGDPNTLDSQVVTDCVRWTTEYCARLSEHLNI